MSIQRCIDSHAAELKAVSAKIWAQPELFYEERFAHELLTGFLEQHGFQVQRSYMKLETAFCATFGSGSPKIAVICEYDALPDIGHACGHNLIAEAGLAAGLGLKAFLEEGKHSGTLVVLGTPAEEGGGGKIDLINAGAFDDIDAALMVHPAVIDEMYAQYLALQEVTIEYFGKAAHSSMYPWEGVNALDAMVTAFSAVGMLRQQLHDACRVHGVITNGGVKPNIIPDYTSAEFYVRAPTAEQMESLKEKMQRCFEGAATTAGCTVKITWVKNPFYDVQHNEKMCELYKKHSESMGCTYLPREEESKVPTGSTDMGNVSYVVPAIHPLYNIESQGAVNHTKEYTAAANTDIAHERTLVAAKSMALVAAELYSCPETLAEVVSSGPKGAGGGKARAARATHAAGAGAPRSICH